MGADCSFAPDAGPSRTGGVVTVRCTLEVDETTGVDETQVTLTVTPEVSAVSLALSTATPAQLQARVTQRSAGSCAVTCVGESPAPTVTAETAVVDEGAVSVAFPSLAPGTSTCTVSCGEPTDPAVFTVFAGDVLNAAALEALASLDAIAGRVAIDEQLTNRVLSSSASVIVGDLSIRDADNTANNVFLRFSNLVSLGGSLVLDSVDDLPSLQDLDQDEDLDEDGVEGPDDFSFPLLTTIGGELKITGNPALLNAVFSPDENRHVVDGVGQRGAVDAVAIRAVQRRLVVRRRGPDRGGSERVARDVRDLPRRRPHPDRRRRCLRAQQLEQPDLHRAGRGLPRRSWQRRSSWRWRRRVRLSLNPRPPHASNSGQRRPGDESGGRTNVRVVGPEESPPRARGAQRVAGRVPQCEECGG
jgi:hypothetical protein